MYGYKSYPTKKKTYGVILRFFLINITLLISVISYSQSTPDSAGPHHTPFLTISGAADIYYRYDLARTASNDLTSFTHSHNQFQLGMAEIKLEHNTGRVGMVADLAFGPREQEYAYPDKGIVQAIKQLYISYSPTTWLRIAGGTWATHLCYESPDAAANRNYSMSYLFSNDPFSHTGIKTEITIGKNGFMIGIANPSNYRSIPDSTHNNKNVIAQYSFTPNDNVKLQVSTILAAAISTTTAHINTMSSSPPGPAASSASASTAASTDPASPATNMPPPIAGGVRAFLLQS